MCGIIGYVGNRSAVDVLIKGLKRLEYRGYDSAGVSFLKDGKLHTVKSEGKLINVEKLLQGQDAKSSRCGIGHTRWATHGRATTQNAHPHRTGHVVLVHNGIIENYLEIRKDILAKGHKPLSETDSELFGFLVLDNMEAGMSLQEAVRQAFLKVHGACSVVVMSDKEPGLVIGIRNGSPLVAAIDPQGGTLLASDAQPILEYTNDVYFLEHGDLVVGKNEGLEFFDYHSGRKISRESVHLDWKNDKMDKQGYPHYMLKEIFDQPLAMVDTFNGALERSKSDAFALAAQPGVDLLKNARQITLVACGTSHYATLLGQYWLEKWARIPVRVELASEFSYRSPVIEPGTLVVAVSQSGETADTLSVIRELKKKGVPTLGISNVRGSTLSREADATFFTFAGPEFGVAATKTFFAQLVMLFLWAGFLAKKSSPQAENMKLFQEFLTLPHLLENALQPKGDLQRTISEIAKKVSNAKGFFFIGRGFSYPIALEGALKLKEIAYMHAEGFAGGELKHGPIAMIEPGIVVVVCAPPDIWRDKVVSNLQEVKARGATIVGIGDSKDIEMKSQCDQWIALPGNQRLDESLYPFLLTPIVQLLSYEVAVLRGTDVDQPRNLAKSVTVE